MNPDEPGSSAAAVHAPPDGASAALVRLADGVRRLIDVTVSVRASRETLDAAAEQVETLVTALRAHVPDPPPSRYPTSGDSTDPASFFPYDVVMGRLNPLAAPIRVLWNDPKAIATVRFGTAYEGPPGCVHGAVIAASFDQVFNVANLMAGTPGPTARLEVRLKRPTPLHTEVRFEGWRERIEGRKVFAAGQLLAGDVLTAEAEGLFILVSAERVMRLLQP